MACESRDAIGGVRRFEIDPANHALDEIVLVGKGQHEAGFGFGGRCLHQHRAVDAFRRQERQQVGGHEVTIDGR